MRKIKGKMLFVLQIVRNIIGYYLKGKEPINPLFACYHLTYDCNLRCSFCSKKAYRSEDVSKFPQLDTASTKKLLRILRKSTSSIYFTGGEPFFRNDLAEIVHYSKELSFYPISVNTNGFFLNDNLEALKNIDVLVVSLHTLNCIEVSNSINVSNTALERIISNIEFVAGLRKHLKFRMYINVVITKKTIAEVREVISFCKTLNLPFSIVPEGRGNTFINEELNSSSEYHEVIKKIKASNKSKIGLINSRRYLDIIDSFNLNKNIWKKDYICFPALIPVVHPDGSLALPCQFKQSRSVNLLDNNYSSMTIKEICLRNGQFRCDRPAGCLRAGVIETSLAINNPLSSILSFMNVVR